MQLYEYLKYRYKRLQEPRILYFNILMNVLIFRISNAIHMKA